MIQLHAFNPNHLCTLHMPWISFQKMEEDNYEIQQWEKYFFFILRVEYSLITFSFKPRGGATLDEIAFLRILNLSGGPKDETCVSLTA